jgi:hypothetical protein
MRRYHFWMPLAVIIAAACGVAYAQQNRGYYNPRNLGSSEQPAAPHLHDGAVYSVESFPLYPPDLESGEGRQEVSSYCSTCHSTRYITMQPPLPADTWTAEVNKMINAFGLELPEDAKPIVLKYLQTHYTPETRKH